MAQFKKQLQMEVVNFLCLNRTRRLFLFSCKVRPPQLSGLVYAQYPAMPDLNPKHAISAFTSYSQILNSDYHYFEERTRINKTNAEFGPYFLRPIYNGLSTEIEKFLFLQQRRGHKDRNYTQRERERERACSTGSAFAVTDIFSNFVYF